MVVEQEVLTPAEVQELLKNPVPLAYTAVDAEVADEQVKTDDATPQVAIEEVLVDDKLATLISLDDLGEHAAALAAELSATDLPGSEQTEDVAADPVVTIESTAQVETPESDAASEAHDDSQSVTPSIDAQEEVVAKDQVTESPVAEDAPVNQEVDQEEEEEKAAVDSEPQVAVGEIIIVADVEVPEGGEAPLPAVEGGVSVLEFLSEANAAGQLKPIEVDVHDEVHPAWAPSGDKKKHPKKAVETIGVVPGLTQKPVEYIKPPGIAEKEARNWNGYSTWWTKLGNRVAKLYNYE